MSIFEAFLKLSPQQQLQILRIKKATKEMDWSQLEPSPRDWKDWEKWKESK